mgnify:CR=1 FL=1
MFLNDGVTQVTNGSFITFADTALNRALTSRESVTEAPNYFIRDLTTGTLTPVTTFPNPYPAFASVQKELIQYKRPDGVALSGTLYLPPGYKPADGPLPTLLWAYPQEFKSADAAGHIKDSPYRFIRVSPMGPLPFLLAGYAVLDDPTMPIVGEGKTEPNDTYIPQLVASAKAAIDELVRRGVTDRNRVAVGGHSYGAFMTANLLAHTDLFKAGIARNESDIAGISRELQRLPNRTGTGLNGGAAPPPYPYAAPAPSSMPAAPSSL